MQSRGTKRASNAMAFGDNKHKNHGSAGGTAWVVVVVVIALLLVIEIYWSEPSNNGASNNSGPLSAYEDYNQIRSVPQNSDPAINSRSTTGSGTSSPGGR
jgi:hypothetical protein